MRRCIAFLGVTGLLVLCSCGQKASTTAPQSAAEAPKAGEAPVAGTQTASGPKVVVHLKSGGLIPGSIVASTQTEMVIQGDNGIESKIPLDQVQSVDYGSGKSAAVGKPMQREVAPVRKESPPETAMAPPPAEETRAPAPAPPAPPPAPVVTTRTYELPVGSEVSVRTNEPIESGSAAEGQTFDAQVTREAKDAEGNVVIPRGADAKVVIRSATKGGRIRGASDLVLDLQSVSFGGKRYVIDTAEVSQKGREGVGANKRTAEFTGGGAALGAIIGAIAGGGKGAAIGAGAGAGAGALTQIVTKGKAIKVPVESVLTFRLDKPLRVTARE